ncbi:DUF427 domain-containing protein [Bailinhaonella thermotolerans]|uniref:DUF427 domain-containing protein n=1 Tax=Bailinhaonella thermotolerans TaxID=1070861 RepID=A0A3A4AFS9_9ACTN|nr:DUF427 domain-containing protein [Bailinhaonella thermotolerans]RJL27199.1 DUF427 domain-containing protein [Bailinhaonella thermotolerans]
MSLTLGRGPLSAKAPAQVNYRVEGPAHRLFLEGFPRRVRAVFDGRTVIDTRRGALLHETGLLPQLYVPEEDVAMELLEPTDHHTVCPFKGEASYWSLRSGDRVVDNAVWAYREPLPEASWLRGLVAFYWTAADSWLDEDEEVRGHLRDPYHRVDVRASSRHVRVLAGETVLAETRSPKVVSETGLPNRYYIPPQDVRMDLLEPSQTESVCPYKGQAAYWSLRAEGLSLDDVAWSFPEPLENALKAAGHLSFLHRDLRVEVDGRPSA